MLFCIQCNRITNGIIKIYVPNRFSNLSSQKVFLRFCKHSLMKIVHIYLTSHFFIIAMYVIEIIWIHAAMNEYNIWIDYSVKWIAYNIVGMDNSLILSIHSEIIDIYKQKLLSSTVTGDDLVSFRRLYSNLLISLKLIFLINLNSKLRSAWKITLGNAVFTTVNFNLLSRSTSKKSH